jgi:hypothetical protein
MRVFHGSDVRIEKIDLSKGGELKDFGRGFYVTNVRKHAYRRSMDIADQHNNSLLEEIKDKVNHSIQRM